MKDLGDLSGRGDRLAAPAMTEGPLVTPSGIALARSGVVLLTGGYGGARLSPSLAAVLPPETLTVVANVGDDLSLRGLRICPDVDSNLYSLAGLWDTERGWGRRAETFAVQDTLDALGVATWFGLGDKDLALHLLRTGLLSQGRTLTEATQLCARKLGVARTTVIPASDTPSETTIVTDDGDRLTFQEWHVRERGRPGVAAVNLPGGPPSPALVQALGRARAVIIGPSNPISSIAPILKLDGVAELVASVPIRIAVSPIVLGLTPTHEGVVHRALMRRAVLRSSGLEDTPASIASAYRERVDTFVADHRDTGQAGALNALGLRIVLTDLLDGPTLAETLASLTRGEPPPP